MHHKRYKEIIYSKIVKRSKSVDSMRAYSGNSSAPVLRYLAYGRSSKE